MITMRTFCFTGYDYSLLSYYFSLLRKFMRYFREKEKQNERSPRHDVKEYKKEIKLIEE